MTTGRFYLNQGQRYIYELLPRLLTLVAARRFGKTDGIQGPYLSRLVSYLRYPKAGIDQDGAWHYSGQ